MQCNAWCMVHAHAGASTHQNLHTWSYPATIERPDFGHSWHACSAVSIDGIKYEVVLGSERDLKSQAQAAMSALPAEAAGQVCGLPA